MPWTPPTHLDYALELLLIAAAGGGAAFAGRRAARGGLGAAIALGLAGVAALCAGLIPWLPWPEPLASLRLPQPIPATLDLIRAAGLVAVGAAIARWPAERPRALLLLLATVAALHVLRGPVSLAIIGPGLAKLDGAASGRGHVRQSTGHTCLPACAAAALRLRGLQLSEGELAARCRTSLFGTSSVRARAALEAAALARGQPLRCELRLGLQPAQLQQLEGPAILSVRLGAIGHAILLRGVDEHGNLLIGDPLDDRPAALSLQAFAQRYRWYGDALILLP